MYNLTESEEFPETIAVPQNEDMRGDAGGTVAAMAQKLANRTRLLLARANASAKLAANNLFTGTNRFPGIESTNLLHMIGDDAERALLGTSVTPSDHPGASANKWKIVFEFKTSGGMYLRIYTGGDGTTLGAFAIVYNALWIVSEQKWAHRDPTKQASALIWHYGRVRACMQATGTEATRWTDWVDGPLAAGSFVHSPTVAAETELELLDALAPDYTYTPADGLIAQGANAYAYRRMVVPPGSTIEHIDIRHYQATGNAAGAILYLLPSTNWATPNAVPPNSANVATAAGTGAGWQTLTLTPGSPIPGSHALRYGIALASGGAGDKFARVRIRWKNGGPGWMP